MVTYCIFMCILKKQKWKGNSEVGIFKAIKSHCNRNELQPMLEKNI